jgi:hypothetical protein
MVSGDKGPCAVAKEKNGFKSVMYGHSCSDNEERFLLGGKAHNAAASARYLVRAGEQKTYWTKPCPEAAYGDCIAKASDHEPCGSDVTGSCWCVYAALGGVGVPSIGHARLRSRWPEPAPCVDYALGLERWVRAS